jgi:hypothetical protein
VENGFATASLDFRQSTEARFPAAIHDIKAAIRFLRAMASEYGYKTAHTLPSLEALRVDIWLYWLRIQSQQRT